jgi:biotin transport system ATP-binding protein
MSRLELRGIRHRAGGRWVLDGVDLLLEEPRIGVVGSNGSGKSTLVRLLNGLVLPTEGRVLVDGLDTRREAAAVRRRVGFVFTDPDAQIVMPTVIEDVALSLRRSDLDEPARAARVTATLERFGLAGLAEQPAHRLSGGEKQLLALASVLVADPDVLVCDEPTTLLDLVNTRRVLGLLAGLPQQVVLVSHDLTVFDGFDRVLVLDGGRVVADGPPEAAVATYQRLALGSAAP